MSLHTLNGEEIERALSGLNETVILPWGIEDGKLSKCFQFKDFQQAFGFMTMVAMACEKMNHHPEWSNVYHRVYIQLRTHDVGSISQKDFDLASNIEAILHQWS